MNKLDNKILYPELSYKLYGLFFATHNSLGRFRSEKSYADALEELLINNKITYVREKALEPSFNVEQERRNIPDFIIEDSIILDIKAKRLITKEDYFQMRRYLVSANKELGLLINFRQVYLTPRRVLNSEHSDSFVD